VWTLFEHLFNADIGDKVELLEVKSSSDFFSLKIEDLSDRNL
jgi:hypothetical protein